MTTFTDLLLGVWIIAVAVVSFSVVPALALGRPPGRRTWWPELAAGAVWSTLAAILLVPLLARFRLLNWATVLALPLSWPLALWLYRYRGAPVGAFRAQCRTLTLRVLRSMSPARERQSDGIARVNRCTTTEAEPSAASKPQARAVAAQPFSTAAAIGTALAALIATARELRFASPADYDTLSHARALLAGGRWIMDPAASLAAVLSRIAAVDAMQALRFMRALTWPGGLIAASLRMASANAAFAWTVVVVAVALAVVATYGVHRRDPWHVVAAALAASLAFGAAGAHTGGGSGYVEYDAAARETLAIARTFTPPDWMVVAPLEQRVELADARRFLSLAQFVKRYADRAADRQFRFDLPGHHLFVFVETRPLLVDPDAALTPVRYARTGAAYWMPNARARLEREARDLCERYRRSHAGVDVYYEDANVRIYRIRH